MRKAIWREAAAEPRLREQLSRPRISGIRRVPRAWMHRGNAESLLIPSHVEPLDIGMLCP